MSQVTSDPVAYLENAGVLGVVLVLWLTGMITSKRELDRADSRAGEWKAQYEREAEAHSSTHQALERERDRMDAATEAGRTASALLAVIGRQLPGPSDGGAT